MEYPVMLYRSSLKDWIIADVEPDVEPLRKQGYRTHAELMAELNGDTTATTATADTADIDERIITDADFKVADVSRADLVYNLEARGIDFKSKANKGTLAKLLSAELTAKGE